MVGMFRAGVLAVCLVQSRAVEDQACVTGDEAGEDVQSLIMVRKHESRSSDDGAWLGCYEEESYGMCYRACADMDEFSPRISASNCGYRENVSFIQRCNQWGQIEEGRGAAPGTEGRPRGRCFTKNAPNKPAPLPNMCTLDCPSGCVNSEIHGSRFCCSDGKAKPFVSTTSGKDIVCSCPAPKPNPLVPASKNVLLTYLPKPCNTGCQDAKVWKVLDGVTYCCPSKHDSMSLRRKFFTPKAYKVQCKCY
jgi:hypothetical protein